jgi:hypothetical protein
MLVSEMGAGPALLMRMRVVPNRLQNMTEQSSGKSELSWTLVFPSVR